MSKEYIEMFGKAGEIHKLWKPRHIPSLQELIDVLNYEISLPGTGILNNPKYPNTYENNKWRLTYFNCCKEYDIKFNDGWLKSYFKEPEGALLNLLMLIKYNKEWKEKSQWETRKDWRISKTDWTHCD